MFGIINFRGRENIPMKGEIMTYQTSNYTGDNVYKINCTGDACIGDEICFERATFTGSIKKPKFDGFEKIEGVIISDSYGRDKQQHTFTLRKKDGELCLIKGRNLYANGVYRKPWTDEQARLKVLEEKHTRGELARSERAKRIENKGFRF